MTNAGDTIGVPITSRRLAPGQFLTTGRVKSDPLGGRRVNLLAAVLALSGIVLPTELQIYIGEAKFTPGRIGIILLLFPALVILCQKGRRALLSDFLACATAAWLVIAALNVEGVSALFSASGSEALEFLGGYLIARAYFFGLPALDTFVRVLKVFAIIAIILAMADSISGRLIVHDTIASIVHASSSPEVGYRGKMVRAASTFDHAILFGVFCALTAAILIYWEKSFLQRSLSVCLCFLGCILSFSSAALLTFLIVLATYTYDQTMGRFPSRWSVPWIVLGTFILALFVLSDNPLSWILRHFTLDPQTGFYRLWIWDAALAYIPHSPMIGYGHKLIQNHILDSSVDSVWLVYSLRFGVPMIVLLILTNVTAFLPTRPSSVHDTNDLYIDRMRRAFTVVLLMFMFSGLTVHFWNYMWIFWGLCIGIRASLRELSIEMAGRSYRYSRRVRARTVS